MKLCSALLFVLLLLGGSSCAIAGDDVADAKPGFAVVELFTSEGCSSCPPADVVLSKIVADARKNGKAIYPLAFHVDYWNRLGWVDHFSSPRFSERQQAYAVALNLDQTYTPQMIVNGSVEFVGSDGARAEHQIESALNAQTASKLKIDVERNGENVKIIYEVASVPKTSVLNLGMVERGLETVVKGGENDGRILQQDNVVRWFNIVQMPTKGQIEMQLPAGVNPKNSSVIAFVQDIKSMKITAATAADLVK